MDSGPIPNYQPFESHNWVLKYLNHPNSTLVLAGSLPLSSQVAFTPSSKRRNTTSVPPAPPTQQQPPLTQSPVGRSFHWSLLIAAMSNILQVQLRSRGHVMPAVQDTYNVQPRFVLLTSDHSRDGQICL